MRTLLLTLAILASVPMAASAEPTPIIVDSKKPPPPPPPSPVR